MGRQRVPLDKITWSLTPSLTSYDDLTPLDESMRTHGIRHRPLLNKELHCIDGARQLEVLRQWGETDVDVIVTDDLEFSIKVIAQRHDSAEFGPGVCRHPLPVQRVETLHDALKPQVVTRLRKIRTRSNKARKTGDRLQRSEQFRPALAKALGMSSETAYSNYIWLAQALRETSGEELAVVTKAVRDLESDRHASIYYAYGAVLKWREQARRAVGMGTVEEQRTILHNTMNMLGGIAPALTPVAELREGHDPAEIAQWLEQLRQFNRITFRLARSLQRSTEQ